MPPPVDLNWIGIGLSVLASILLGMVWYAPPVFGRRWMTLLGKREEDMADMRKGAAKAYAVAIVSAFVVAFVMSFFVDYMQSKTLAEGALTGLLLWVGFVATSMTVTSVFENKPAELTVISSAYHMAEYAAVGAILAYFA